jgi:protoporphyrinogen oxidase
MNNIIGRIDPKDNEVAIWGAGFAGLVMGYYLKKAGYKITIYEKSNRPGGKIKTRKTAFGPAETGANALYLNADGLELIRELKLDPIPASKHLRRLLLLNGRPRRAFQIAALFKLFINIHKKPPLISDGLTVADFFRPLLGNDIINHYLSPALGGIYATPAESLHFKSIFQLAANKTQFNSYWEFFLLLLKSKKAETKIDLTGSISFDGGMQALINRLAEELKPHIRLNYKDPFFIRGNTIICTDALNASLLTKKELPEISVELQRIRYQELTSATVFLKREIKNLNRSFGVLIPTNAEFHSSGVLNNKAIFPINNSNVFSYTLISRKKLVEKDVHHDIKLLNHEFVPEDVEHLELTHWEKAIPIYDLQRYLSVKKLHQLVPTEKNIAIFGNFVAGISLRDMITLAKNFANEYMNSSKEV